MLNKLRHLDTIELMILVGIFGIMIFGGFHLYLRNQVELSREAFARAQDQVVEIHALLPLIPKLYRERQKMQAGAEDINPAPFFQRQFTNEAKIPLQSYEFGSVKPTEQTLTVKTPKGRTKRMKAKLRTIKISFPSMGRNKKTFLPRSNLFRALYNAEAASPRWRLRRLRIKAKETVVRERGKDKAPPEELSDLWLVQALEFASREPIGK
ncbi:MAG: hypothetical protein CSA62_01860 [Planctomycetota bacterium]|nr:MAG: hypothetical protein CSA62_01860 [Planctomycetota bacterium]